MTKPRIHLVAAARPNFMKIAPLYHQLIKDSWCKVEIVHTGQHYDPNMSADFFRDFRLPEPHHHLGIGSGSHATQTANVMLAYEKICLDAPPDWLIVVGDVNSTVACALVAAKLHIPIAHLEAGLRSGDRSMPEEINRIVTDALSDLLWTPSPDGDENLLREGKSPDQIDRVGNIMIDSFEMLKEKISADTTSSDMGLERGAYALATLHRPSNVDDKNMLAAVFEEFKKVAEKISLVLPLHPRTRKQSKAFGLLSLLENSPGITLVEPVAYIQFMNLVQNAKLIVTDSGGIQEETSYLGIPCLTLRENTERPITTTLGTNRLVQAEQLSTCVDSVLNGNWQEGQSIPLWDGKTAERVSASLRRRLAPTHEAGSSERDLIA